MSKAHKFFSCHYKRYSVQAKRKNTNEAWTDWTIVDDYDAAVKHAARIEALGYDAQIIDRGETSDE